MLLLAMGAVLILVVGPDAALLWLLPLASAIGLVWGVGCLRRPHRAALRWFGAIALEELLTISWLSGTEFGYGSAPVRIASHLVGTLVVGWLLVRGPLPDRWLPLRGSWLRRLLAAVGLAALAVSGPWSYLWGYWAFLCMPGWPLVLGVTAGALGMFAAVEALAEGVRVSTRRIRPAES